MGLTPGFWRDRRVLLTGHTGFKGGWLAAWLDALGARVTGLALPAQDPRCIFSILERSVRIDQVIGDIRDADTVSRAYDGARPEVVFHLAAQALVSTGYASPRETLSVNIDGTSAVLDAAQEARDVSAVVVVTSDKVYSRHLSPGPHTETDPLGGDDPYSASKACAELVVDMYRSAFLAPAGIAVATARAGNVIGGGDWADHRLVPDCARAREAESVVELRYPDAVRPWQHVLDPLLGYLMLAEALVTMPDATPPSVNFGPPDRVITVHEIVERLANRWKGSPSWIRSTDEAPPESPELRLSSRLARESLGWTPALDIDAAIEWTAEWYAVQRDGGNVGVLSLAQLAEYREMAE